MEARGPLPDALAGSGFGLISDSDSDSDSDPDNAREVSAGWTKSERSTALASPLESVDVGLAGLAPSGEGGIMGGGSSCSCALFVLEIVNYAQVYHSELGLPSLHCRNEP